jgi:hypothetical protein
MKGEKVSHLPSLLASIFHFCVIASMEQHRTLFIFWGCKHPPPVIAFPFFAAVPHLPPLVLNCPMSLFAVVFFAIRLLVPRGGEKSEEDEGRVCKHVLETGRGDRPWLISTQRPPHTPSCAVHHTARPMTGVNEDAMGLE